MIAKRLTTALLLAGILALATYLRGVGIDWDEGRQLHPDERFLSMVEGSLDPVSSLREYFDTLNSPLNPNNRGFKFFVYGTFPLVVVQYLGVWFEQPGNDLDRLWFGRELDTNFASFHLLGRALSASCDVIATLLVFLAGSRLYGRAAGLLAAAFYATAVLPIQQAHFFTVDAIANLFFALALWLAVRACTRERWSDDLLFGVAVGAGVASKLSIVPVALLLVLAVAVRFGASSGASLPEAPERASARFRAQLVRAALSVNVMLLAALLTFRLLQPYAFLPSFSGSEPDDRFTAVKQLAAAIFAPQMNPLWLEQMEKVRALQTGNDDAPPNHQWATRTPMVFPWINLVRFGLGWPLGLLAWAAWCAAAVEGLRGRAQSWRHVLPVAWVGLYFAWYGGAWVTTMRYFLPLYPVLTILAGWSLVRLIAPEHDASLASGTAPRASISTARRLAGVVVAVLILSSTAAWAIAFTGIYRRPHTRIAATRWIYANLPADVSVSLRTADGDRIEPIGLPNDWLLPGPSPEDRVAPTAPASYLSPDAPRTIDWRVDQPAELASIRFHRIEPLAYDPTEIQVELLDPEDPTPLVRCHLGPITAAADDALARCDPATFPLAADRRYRLRLSVQGAPVVLRGTEIAHEGHWDDGVPMSMPGYEPWQALYQIRGLEVVWEDHEEKRRRFQYILDGSEYLTISSNRFYDSLTRNPRRWPMTIDYYRALFSGNLGFELVADFQSLPCVGNYCIDDREGEEAFSVYDHPRVLIFRKTAAYTPANTAAILGRADLTRVERWRADRVHEAPVRLSLPTLSAARLASLE